MTDSPETPRRLRRPVVWFFAFGTVAAAAGFAFKLYHFTGDLLDEQGLQFAGVHLLTYLCVAAGFIALLAVCFLTGQFSDIEQPKFDLLEKERRYDRDHPELAPRRR